MTDYDIDDTTQNLSAEQLMEVIIDMFYEGLTSEEIASELDIDFDLVDKTLARRGL